MERWWWWWVAENLGVQVVTVIRAMTVPNMILAASSPALATSQNRPVVRSLRTASQVA